MTDFTRPTAVALPRPVVLHREGTEMLLHEALARSRQREAEEAARQFALARRCTAGRGWATLAGFAARRAARARADAGAAPLHSGSRSAGSGLRGAI
jgi:hypothetical protein